MASMTRETSILVLGGVFCFETIQAVRCAAAASRWRRVLICGLALVSYLVWRELLRLAWGVSPQNASGDLGWPLLGIP